MIYFYKYSGQSGDRGSVGPSGSKGSQGEPGRPGGPGLQVKSFILFIKLILNILSRYEFGRQLNLWEFPRNHIIIRSLHSW